MDLFYKWRILVFGTGEFYKRKKIFLKKFNIIAFVDNDKTKQGCEFDGTKIISAEEIKKYSFDYICILSMYEESIILQLTNIGISEDKILRFSQIGLLDRNPAKYDYYTDLLDSEIVFIANAMSLSGGAIALYNFANVVKKMGYKCVVLSIFNGPLCSEYERKHIKVYEECDLNKTNVVLFNILQSKIVVCNSIFLREFACSLNEKGIKTIWWIHESEGFPPCIFESSKQVQNQNFEIYCVGPKAIELIEKKFIGFRAKNLLYMVPREESLNDEKKRKSEIRFAIIGNVVDYKGQDIFIKAVKKLSINERKKCLFEIIGPLSDNNYCNDIKTEAKDLDQVYFLGNVTHNELLKHYKDIDVIVCSSRIDTMPTVVVEGMMNKKCCIVSPQVGIVEYMTDMVTGIVMNELTQEELMKKMKWVINNFQKAKQIGEKSYEIYKNYFSEENFEKNVIDILGKFDK